VHPCHEYMTRPQTADSETAFRYGEYLRIYQISSREEPRCSGPPACVLGEVLTNSHFKNLTQLRNSHKSLGMGLVLLYQITMAQDRDRWRAFLNAVVNLWVP
jgi:hypothetical protein